MAEHGLTAKVIPEIDEEGMRKFITSFTEGLVNVDIPININGQIDSSSNTSADPNNANSQDRESRVGEISEGVTKGTVDFVKNYTAETELGLRAVTDAITNATNATSPIGTNVKDIGEKFGTNFANLLSSITNINELMVKIASGNGLTDTDKTQLTKAVEGLRKTVEDFTGEVRKDNSEKKQTTGVTQNLMGRMLDKAGINASAGAETKDMVSGIMQKVLPEMGTKLAGGIATGVGVIVVIADMVDKFLKMITDASPALQTVMSLIEQAVNLILMPVGTILAIELMPLIRDMYSTLAEWMGSAMEIYEKEGWYGLIKGALEVGVEMLGEWLTEYLPVIGGMIWEIIDGFMHSDVIKNISPTLYIVWSLFSDVLVPMITTIVDFWGKLLPALEFIVDRVDTSSLSSFITSLWDALQDSGIIDDWVNAFLGIFGNIDWDKLINDLTPIFTKFSTLIETVMKSFLPFGAVQLIQSVLDGANNFFNNTQGVQDWVEEAQEDPAGTAIDVVSLGMPSIAGAIYEWAVNGENPIDYTSRKISEIGDFFGGLGKHAEGGIATQATAGIFGEAGPEAIIPLDRFSEVMNQYQTNNNVEYGGATIVNNWYIYGATDPKATATEVQHTLEKVVGKSYSKVKRWN